MHWFDLGMARRARREFWAHSAVFHTYVYDYALYIDAGSSALLAKVDPTLS